MIAVAAMANRGGNNSSAPPCTASYPDKQSGDHCTSAAGQVTLSGMTVTASALKRTSSPEIGTTELCTDVSYRNDSSSTQPYNRFDWKLQNPSGQVQSFELTFASTLNSGDLVFHGTVSGIVCFSYQGQDSLYVLIWKPNPYRPDRGIWLTTLWPQHLLSCWTAGRVLNLELAEFAGTSMTRSCSALAVATLQYSWPTRASEAKNVVMES